MCVCVIYMTVLMKGRKEYLIMEMPNFHILQNLSYPIYLMVFGYTSSTLLTCYKLNRNELKYVYVFIHVYEMYNRYIICNN